MYKKVYGLKIYGAIFYNHESPKRSNDYVTKKIVEIASPYGVHIHCDAVQALGKIPIDFNDSH